jgi:L-fucono-1,5-lactonase
MRAPRIDSHQHFWFLERGDYEWLTPDMGVLYKDFFPEDLEPKLKKANIDKSVLVQAAPTLQETQFLLTLAQESDFIAGVVGWVDMEKNCAPDQIQRLCENPHFLGIRPLIQDIPDAHWMLKPSLTPALQAIIDHKKTFDALVKPQHLKNLLVLIQQHPDLKVVIDHCAKPNIAGGQFESWAADIEVIARTTSAYCKLSGLLTEAGDSANAETLKPYVDHILQCFGVDRVMWGSDWPVLELAADYHSWQAMSVDLMKHLSSSDVEHVFGKTATDFYQLHPEDRYVSV